MEAGFSKVKKTFFFGLITAGEDSAKPVYEVRGSRRFLHHLPGPASVQRLRPIRGHQNAAQHHGHRLPQTDLQGQDHPVHVDRDAHHGVGSW